MNPPPVKRYGQYEVLQESDGRDIVHALGTHDVTYRATDSRLDRRVHLRVLRPECLSNAALKDAFLAATRSLAKIRHSNISGVLDVGEGREGCYCAIEDPSGESLESVIGRLGCMDARTALSILDQCAKVLRELWQSGQSITRLSPATIAVCYEGDELIIKFTDLHLAPSSEAGLLLTVGKSTDAQSDFWSPEESSSKALDIRSNIFSLGLVFCELLGGRGSSAAFIAPGDISRVSESDVFRKLPEKILYLLELMLKREPADRIQTPYDLRSLIEQCEREGGVADFSLIRTDNVSGMGQGEDRPEEDILPMEFNLRKTLDPKGVYREADDRVRGGVAVIRLFGADESPMEVAACASLAEKLLAHPHPNIVHILRVQTSGRHRFIAYERVEGNNLLEIMRKRRRLTLPEVLVLLTQAASVADHGVEHDVSGLAFNLSMVRVVLGDQASGEKKEGWMALPCHQWPPFTLKIPVYGSAPGLDAEASTIGAQSTREARLATYLSALGETAHELLGGVKPRNIPFNQASYTPLSTLSEQGNILLRRALFGEGKPAFASAAEFVSALQGTVADKDFPTSSSPTVIPKGAGVGKAGAGEPPRGSIGQGALTRKSPLKVAVIVMLLLIAAIIAALVVFQTESMRPTAQPEETLLPDNNQPEISTEVPQAQPVETSPSPAQAPDASMPDAVTPESYRHHYLETPLDNEGAGSTAVTPSPETPVQESDAPRP